MPKEHIDWAWIWICEINGIFSNMTCTEKRKLSVSVISENEIANVWNFYIVWLSSHPSWISFQHSFNLYDSQHSMSDFWQPTGTPSLYIYKTLLLVLLNLFFLQPEILIVFHLFILLLVKVILAQRVQVYELFEHFLNWWSRNNF